MEQKFKETNILEDYSRMLNKQCITLGPSVTPFIATTLFDGVSRCLGAIKNKEVPQAIVFKTVEGSFIAAAKIEYVEGSDPTSSRWDYTWTFYEDDVKGANIVDASTNNMILHYFEQSALTLYKMKFAGPDVCIILMNLMLEMIKKWLTENTKAGEDSVLTLEGVFKAVATINGDEIELGLIPDGDMKVLVKDDTALQN